MLLDDTGMSETALGGEKITRKQEKQEKISCALCSCTLNSETQAQAHFSGVRHLKLLEKHGLPLPEGVDRDKLFAHQRKTQQNGIRFWCRGASVDRLLYLHVYDIYCTVLMPVPSVLVNDEVLCHISCITRFIN